MIIYSCIFGFQVVGYVMQICEELGWFSFILICVFIDCGFFFYIDFGDCIKVKDGQGYFDQEEDVMEVLYVIFYFFRYLGVVVKIWKNIKGFFVIYLVNFLYGIMVLYICNLGYEFLGNFVLICQEDGIWNGSVLFCILIECDLFVVFENGFLYFIEIIMGSVV